MPKRGSYFPEEKSDKDWDIRGVVCLTCGQRFYGNLDKAGRECANHSAVEHPRGISRYAVMGDPLSFEARKKAKGMTSVDEAVLYDRILREHGTGWYFYALHYGAQEALARIHEVEMMEGEEVETLKEKVERRKAEQVSWIHD